MSLPTVAQLCSTLGDNLTAHPGSTAPEVPVTAVHVSELTDPTAFLSGGELLLTTGLALPASQRALRAYAARLREVGTVALAFGVGPVHDTVPEPLARACQAEGLPLLVVPPPTPFLTVTHAYWRARTASDRVGLADAVSGQHALARAMLADDPGAELARTLSLALSSWVAVVGVDGDVEQVHPTGRVTHAVAAAAAAGLEDLRDVHSAASFRLADDTVVVFPIPLRDRVTGYVVIGSDHRLTGTQRRLAHTATALLSVDRGRGARLGGPGRARREAVAELLDMGQPQVAARLAPRFGLVPPTGPVRVLAVRSETEGSEAAADAVLHWAPTALPSSGAGRSRWFVIVDDVPPDLDDLRSRLAARDAGAVAILSPAVALTAVHEVRSGLLARLAGLAPGTVTGPRSPTTGAATGALDRLMAYRRADLVPSLAAYLRHRGGWDPAARELGVHRNTLRHRIERCRAVTDVDVDDPDVAAELWLDLRATGLA